MAFTFQRPVTAQIVAPIGGSSTAAKLTIDGTNSDETSADNAAEQINKITSIFNVEVSANGMTRIIKEGAENNG